LREWCQHSAREKKREGDGEGDGEPLHKRKTIVGRDLEEKMMGIRVGMS